MLNMINVKDLHIDSFKVARGEHTAILYTTKNYTSGDVEVMAQISPCYFSPRDRVYVASITIYNESGDVIGEQYQNFTRRIEPIDLHPDVKGSEYAPTLISKKYMRFVKDSIKMYREIFHRV